MTHAEKRKLAVARELELLRESVRKFDQVVAEAQALARDCRAAVDRLDAIEHAEERLDQKIDALERMTGRGKYRDGLSATIVDIGRTTGGL